MVSAKFIHFFAISATSVFAAPGTELLEARDTVLLEARDTVLLEARNTILHCQNVALDYTANSLSLDSIKKQISETPAKVGKFGYPHEFKNHRGMIIFNEACHGRTLHESPVSKDGTLYKYESKPKDNPGPFRGIATADGPKGKEGQDSDFSGLDSLGVDLE
ncbi:hypothetical protein LTR28_005077 [Elasticomyces elasticus]|nr:hypothetical protein LTR28_005077 [Elasticomyces elasticus]